MKRFSKTLMCLLLAIGLSSCASNRWVFAVSKHCYGERCWLEGADFGNTGLNCEAEACIAIAAVLLAPVAIDVALLPITGAHDLLLEAR